MVVRKRNTNHMTVYQPVALPDEFACEEAIEDPNDGQTSNGRTLEGNGSDVSEAMPTMAGADDDEPPTMEEREAAVSSSSTPEKLGVASMTVLMFYTVSGGPFGIETTVRAGGNLCALLGFLLMPWVWSVQEALVTAELGTAFPDDASGGVAWVEEAFGPRIGFVMGFLSWIAGATDNSIYPVLFVDYLLQVVGHKDKENHDSDASQTTAISDPLVRFCLVAGITIILTCVNWRGLALVGRVSILICIVAMSPFAILIVVGSFKVDPSRWFVLPDGDVDIRSVEDNTDGGFFPNLAYGGVLWRPFLNNLFWNLNSFDSGAAFVAELESTRSYVRAMVLTVPIVAAGYFLPLLVAIGSSDATQSEWTDGYLATVNAEVVGPWLGAWTVLAAGISNVGLFQAELSGDAFKLMGMADRGYLPKLFAERSPYGAPTYGLALGAAVIVAMGTSDVERLVELMNCNYGIVLLLEYAAFFKLRMSRPDLPRPYRIPLDTLGCAVLFFPTIVSTIFVMSLATYATYGFAIGSWMAGYGLYSLGQKRNHAPEPEETALTMPTWKPNSSRTKTTNYLQKYGSTIAE